MVSFSAMTGIFMRSRCHRIAAMSIDMVAILSLDGAARSVRKR